MVSWVRNYCHQAKLTEISFYPFKMAQLMFAEELAGCRDDITTLEEEDHASRRLYRFIDSYIKFEKI